MKNILKYLKKYLKECIIAPLFKMTEAIFELMVPLVIANMIDNGIKLNNQKLIIISFIILLVFAILGFSCTLCAQYFSAKAATGFAKDLKNDLFLKIGNLSYQDLDKIGSHTLITRMTSEINLMQTGVNMFLRLFLRSPFVLLGALILGLVVNLKLGLIFVVTIPILFIVVFSIILTTMPKYKDNQVKLEKLLKRTNENLKGARVIKAFCEEENEQLAFKKEAEDLEKGQIKTAKISALMNPLTFILINVALVLVIYLGGKEVYNSKLLQGSVVAEFNLMSQILVELIKFANLTVTLTKALAASKRINELLLLKPSQTFIETSNLKENTSPYLLEFKNVSLKYQNNKENTLTNLSFKLKKGESLGIIGSTGSGKTSLINLIPRFYDLTDGEIIFDGNNLFNYNQEDLRKKISLVSQKSTLFSGTIKDNLLMAYKEASNDDINKALEIAQAKELVFKKEQGLETKVLPLGKNFSGGEKQRLCIAQGIIKPSDLIILDDAASALDYLTDKNLREKLKETKKTRIIVSERIISLIDCDQILILDEGLIKGIGSHEELLKTNKIYQEIYESQFKGEAI